MLPAVVFALTLIAAPAQPAWRMTESPHFEVHYLPEASPDLDRVVRAAEQAYRDVSGRLNFVLPTKVPMILFAPSAGLTREQVTAYATSETIAPHVPHRSRIVLPLTDAGTRLDAQIAHELTHLLVCEIVTPGQSGDGGLPRWMHEGLANYMTVAWSDDDDRLLRELVASGAVPAVSQLTGTGGFANARINDALGHAAFDFIESRWGAGSIRRFVNAHAVPRTSNPYEAAFAQTPAQFDAAFREYVARRFGARP